MYCKNIITARLSCSVYPLVDAPDENYYNPEQNCMASVGGKNLCGICGEKHKWLKGGTLKTHTTKCCPYRYHSGIASRKDFTDAIAEMIHFEKLSYTDKYENLETSYDALKENEISLITNSLEQSSKITDLESNLNFMKEMFSPTQIQIREAEIKEINTEITDKLNVIRKEDKRLQDEELEINKKMVLLQISQRTIEKNKSIVNDLTEYQRKLHITLHRQTESMRMSKVKIDELETEKIDIFESSIQVGQDNLDLLKIIQSGKNNIQTHYKQFCIFCQDCIDEKGLTTDCGHHFHLDCYNSYIKHKIQNLSYGSVNCPLCNAKFFDV
jgi:hypothetical protein